MKISVLGCGWLGFPVAQQLLKSSFIVQGSTTTKEKISLLKNSGITPYLIEVPDSVDNPENSSFWDSDILFLNIPPARRKYEGRMDYPDRVRLVVNEAKKGSIQWIIFASSTSVYGRAGGVVSEEDVKEELVKNHYGEDIFRAEKIISQSSFDSTILRFGGLYGYDRHPVNHLSGKTNLSGADKPINLVHREDCISVLETVLLKEKRNTIYNVVSDGHPPRKEFYQCAANHFDLPLPRFSDEKSKNNKVVSNLKLKKELDYTFNYPNPMDHTP